VNAFNRIEEYIMIITLPVMVVLVFGATVVRFFRLGSVPWADEGARYLMILLIFVGTAYGFRRNIHLGVSYVVDRLPARIQFFCIMLRTAILLGFAALMLHSTTSLIQLSMGFVQRTASLNLPMYQVYYIMLLGWILMIIRIIQAALYDVIMPMFAKKKPDPTKSEIKGESEEGGD